MQLDLKPHELLEYEGISPCPIDMDEFWNESIKEVESINAKVELNRTATWIRNAEAFDMYFSGIGGDRVYAKYIRPENAKKVPVVFAFHGYRLMSLNWSSCLSYVSQGFAVVAMDCRGQGGKSQDLGGVVGNTSDGQFMRGIDADSSKDLLFRKIFLDTAQLVRIVEKFEEIDETRMYTMGGSQGGALALVCAALSPQIRKVSACCPFLCDYQRVWELDRIENAYIGLKDYFRKFDPRHEREADIFYRLGYIDVQNLAKRIKAEVYLFTGLMDTFCPPSTQFAAFNKICSPKRAFFYPEYGHETYPDEAEITMEWFSKI